MRQACDLPRLVDEASRIALGIHGRFEAERWQGNPMATVTLSDGTTATPSYHNGSHVRSVVMAARAVLSALPASDPFGIGADLARWNGGDAGRAVPLDLMAPAAEVAFACHDLGNVCASGDMRFAGADGSHAEVELATRYDSSVLYDEPEVEIRSAALARRVLHHLLPDSPERRLLAPLVDHLILQTVFQFEKVASDEPFWLFMQTVDMVGSYFFTPVPRHTAVAGLFNEMNVQKPGYIVLHPFLASLKVRFDRLLPDEGRRQAVSETFHANPFGQHDDVVFATPRTRADLSSPIPLPDAIRLLLEDPSLWAEEVRDQEVSPGTPR